MKRPGLSTLLQITMKAGRVSGGRVRGSKNKKSDFSGSREGKYARTSKSESTDKNRHCQSDKIRRSDWSRRTMPDLDRSRWFQSDRTRNEINRLEKKSLRVIAKSIRAKCRRTRSLLTGFQFGGI